MEEPHLPSLEQMTDILDIEGIILLPWKTIALYTLPLLILLGLGLVVWAFLKFLRRRKLSGAGRHLSPAEQALWELARLEQQQLVQKGEFKKYYFFLSEIFRRYLEERFQYPAIDKTTDEILPYVVHDLPVQPDVKTILEDFLRGTDLVKFSGFRPGEERAIQDRECVVAFVKQTVPDPGSYGEHGHKPLA